MRVTRETRIATRARILDAARTLFAARGFDATTTRDLAAESGIAAGTLFNYFASKEAIATAIVRSAMRRAEATFERRSQTITTLEEDLFALAAAVLRELRPCRGFLRPVLEAAMSPAVRDGADGAGEGDGASIRIAYLELVQGLAAKHRAVTPVETPLETPLPTVALQLAWTLYTGVLSFWIDDASPDSEDTLAMLDESTTMFVQWLRSRRPGEPEKGVTP